MTYPLICDAGPGIDRDAAATVCEGFMRVLAEAYPAQEFTRSDSSGNINGAAGQASLLLQITQANRSGTAIRLVWTDSSGQSISGDIAAVSAMDRPVTPSMQLSLFQRALAETPMPE
ncbi:hypothetical protein HOY34_02345 [Xinfangfangia sp. D13-10-4-6]|uniref:hypothetical protein n=1 Tax=Pseudogemmobacter hezensis TaxID=2737662 RepID=UPI00155772A4|nr:hypothetical protein [Pseudogemmobacter hezensis]NPD14037.1 hypothetical protein [Pseudogemmobacter hezensis]